MRALYEEDNTMRRIRVSTIIIIYHELSACMSTVQWAVTHNSVVQGEGQ